ncbi:alpha/beta fold hydrolase [Kitasatospora sp. MAP5-34]|uniref:thioesterase II family protein n=1 Tax=Kitasatospora sp. MAP5-34 TaxID=3035102 RepID=UPI002475339B|nr:alpha/beta fold hydrolase [Kitasatospora sp. MAP5-34]
MRIPVPRPAARLRLLCFHPAGGGPRMYRDWASELPEDIEVLAVQLPGRETRIGEPCLTDYERAVQQLHAALRRYLDCPYALFGHSMGALLAYGVAVAAAQHGDRAPERLLVSGCAGPGIPHPKAGRPGWSDQELVADLRSMGGTPEEVLANPELLSLILPTLRADFALCDTFRRPAGPLLDCPLTVLGGLQDIVTPEGLRHWAGTTSAGTSVHTYPGGHFFLTEESAASVLATVSAALAAATSA